MASERPTAESLPKEPLARLLAVMAWLRDRQHGCPWDIDQTFRDHRAVHHRGSLRGRRRHRARRHAGAEGRARRPAAAGRLPRPDGERGRRLRLRRRGRRHRRQDGRPPSARLRRRSGSPTPRPRPCPGRPARRPSGRPRGGAEPAGALDGVARALPALLRAEKIQKRAARVGFDWKTDRAGHRQDRGGTGRAAGRARRPARSIRPA